MTTTGVETGLSGTWCTSPALERARFALAHTVRRREGLARARHATAAGPRLRLVPERAARRGRTGAGDPAIPLSRGA